MLIVSGCEISNWMQFLIYPLKMLCPDGFPVSHARQITLQIGSDFHRSPAPSPVITSGVRFWICAQDDLTTAEQQKTWAAAQHSSWGRLTLVWPRNF